MTDCERYTLGLRMRLQTGQPLRRTGGASDVGVTLGEIELLQHEPTRVGTGPGCGATPLGNSVEESSCRMYLR